MALADPQSVTINAIANSLPRVSSGDGFGGFRKDDGSVELLASHKVGNRARHTIRLNHNKVAVDPLVSTVNRPYSMSVIVTVDTPVNQGYTNTEIKQTVEGLLGWFTASSSANLIKIIGGES
jgi:hypothetical protein